VYVFNNLRRIFKLMNDSDTSTKKLGLAQQIDPDRYEQLLLRSGDKAGSEEAGKVSGEGGREYRFNRFFASMPLPEELIWERLEQGSPLAAAVNAGLWRAWMGPLKGLGHHGSLGGLLAAMAVFRIWRRRWRLSYRCASCGQPICRRCEPTAKDPRICSPCYYVLREPTGGGLNLPMQMTKRTQAQWYRDLWTRGGWIASLILPGSGLLALGDCVLGTLFFSAAALLLAGPLEGLLVRVETLPAYHGGISPVSLLLLILYLVLMLAGLLVYRLRVDRWR
jgi:hypothetical protein